MNTNTARLTMPDGQTARGINGVLPLELRTGKFFHVIGGPYTCRPAGTFGIKLAKEINAPFDLSIPSEDFGTPSPTAMVEGVEIAVAAVLKGQLVYAGCMGGIGRTGLFLACLAKAFGADTPLDYVRTHYLPHAVETAGQKAMIMEFEPSARTVAMIRWALLKSWVGLQKGLTAFPKTK